MAKKYYVVWEGKRPGIYDSWQKCQTQINGYAGAKFKSYKTRTDAEFAFANPVVAQKEINAKKKTIYYVVWKGFKPGIYTSWKDTQAQIVGASHPKFKSFGSKIMAEKAFDEGPEKYAGRSFKKVKDFSQDEFDKIGEPDLMTISVDAASNAKTGVWEYRGVITESGTEIFRVGPYPEGSNNIGEFLALVHGLAYLKKSRSDIPVYTDSRIAMGWVRSKNARPKKAGAKSKELIARAEKWLNENDWNNPILKWETKAWGEIPADFGRK